MKCLNGAVTEAIFRAEEHDREGARLWDEVAACERAIYETADSDFSETEKEIARRGIELASGRAGVLRDFSNVGLCGDVFSKEGDPRGRLVGLTCALSRGHDGPHSGQGRNWAWDGGALPGSCRGIEIVEAPGDRCGNTKKLSDGSPCPGCRACA